MIDFFKQLLQQFSGIWSKLTATQRLILVTIVIVCFAGFVVLMVWVKTPEEAAGTSTLYTNLTPEDAGTIVEKLREGGHDYKLDNGGTTIRVSAKKVYEIRMILAKDGLPRSGGVGYEIFDRTNLGMTDFVQNLNFKRALEGELMRTIKELEEVDQARVHLVLPKPTIFTEREKFPTASIVVKLRPGKTLTQQQVKGITHLVAASVEGLKPGQVTVVDINGNMLSNTFGDNEVAERSSHNIDLQHSVERTLEGKVQSILDGILGPNKSHTKVVAGLNFEQIKTTQEKYDPESQVVRSEERNEANSQEGGGKPGSQSENSITNYEIDRTVQEIVNSVGNINRLSISVVIDGSYQKGEKGERVYRERTAEEIIKIEDLVKKAVGFDEDRDDQISVVNLRFNHEFVEDERRDMVAEEKRELYLKFVKWGILALILIVFILFLKSISRYVVEALNPPIPVYTSLSAVSKPEEIAEVPEEVRESNELLDRVELLVKQEPQNIAQLVRTWLNDVGESDK